MGSMHENVVTAVILAAGMGRRLADEYADSPKGFLALGGKSIVEELIDKLVVVGIQRVVIVTGYLAEFYDELAASRPGVLETVHNPHYFESGSGYSLYCARHLLDENFLLLESDLVRASSALYAVGR